jgi:hypothetical protein
VLVFGTGQGEAKLVLFEACTILLFDACVELIAEEENRSRLDDDHKGLSGIRIEHGCGYKFLKCPRVNNSIPLCKMET